MAVLLDAGAASPGITHFAITPSDTDNFALAARRVFVGTTGNVSLVDLNGTSVLYKNVPSGGTIDMYASRINATLTTATDLVGQT